MVFHPQRHSAWRASWTGARALQNNDGSIHHCYKGTVRQAVMLGVAATLSHTAVVWLIAFGGMYISNKFTAESAEPWLQMVSSVIILGTAFWMFWRTWSGEKTGWRECRRMNIITMTKQG